LLASQQSVQNEDTPIVFEEGNLQAGEYSGQGEQLRRWISQKRPAKLIHDQRQQQPDNDDEKPRVLRQVAAGNELETPLGMDPVINIRLERLDTFSRNLDYLKYNR